MLTLNNITTQDNYINALQLGPAAEAKQVSFVVANAAVFAQLAPHSASKVEQEWGQEILITPSTGAYTNIQGMRFRSAVPGKPAQVVAQLTLPADPLPLGSSVYSASLSAGGGVTPGFSSVQIQKDGALVGTEPILDILTAGSIPWVIADDVANTRVTLTPKIAISAWAGGPPAGPVDGEIWIATAVLGSSARWMFQYNSGEPTYKWLFVGGSPYTVASQPGINVSALTQIGALGWFYDPAVLTNPLRAGQYIGDAITLFSFNGGAATGMQTTTGFVTPNNVGDGTGTGIVYIDATVQWGLGPHEALVTLAAGQKLVPAYAGLASNTVIVSNIILAVTPRAII